jgi:hypothetical protein
MTDRVHEFQYYFNKKPRYLRENLLRRAGQQIKIDVMDQSKISRVKTEPDKVQALIRRFDNDIKKRQD